MTERVTQLLDRFDALPDPDKRTAMTEILRRHPLGEDDIPASDLDELAGELFATLDAEEAARAPDR